jgi:hypothetical protein
VAQSHTIAYLAHSLFFKKRVCNVITLVIYLLYMFTVGQVGRNDTQHNDMRHDDTQHKDLVNDIGHT